MRVYVLTNIHIYVMPHQKRKWKKKGQQIFWCSSKILILFKLLLYDKYSLISVCADSVKVTPWFVLFFVCSFFLSLCIFKNRNSKTRNKMPFLGCQLHSFYAISNFGIRNLRFFFLLHQKYMSTHTQWRVICVNVLSNLLSQK